MVTSFPKASRTNAVEIAEILGLAVVGDYKLNQNGRPLTITHTFSKHNSLLYFLLI